MLSEETGQSRIICPIVFFSKMAKQTTQLAYLLLPGVTGEAPTHADSFALNPSIANMLREGVCLRDGQPFPLQRPIHAGRASDSVSDIRRDSDPAESRPLISAGSALLGTRR